MNLITKRVHMNRCNGREVKQLTLDRDFNVPDARPDALQIMKEQGEVQIEEVHMMEGKARSEEHTSELSDKHRSRMPSSD